MPGHRKRRRFKQTDAFTRGMVIGLKRAGWSIRQIAADTHLGASTVHRLWRRWLEQGNVTIYRNVGATRVTSARVDRRILRQAVAAPQATCTAILQHVQDTLDHSISTRTISRRLIANGLHSCRPLRRLPLTPPNRRQRLEWCRARSTWMTEWHRVVFSDESRFFLSSDSCRVRVWRRRGERSNPAAIVERPTVRQRGIMVWGAIAYDSRSPLLRIQGTMTAQRYVDDVLRPVTLPYLQGVPNALYQQDNARPHTARISKQALQDVQMLPWPPYSPDLSPIEHVWDIIGRRLHALPQPRSEVELWQMVEREWRAIPQDAIRTLIDSLPRRVAACIAVRVISIEDSLAMSERVLLWRGDRSWADLVLGEVGGSFISVVGDHFFRVTVQRLARKGRVNEENLGLKLGSSGARSDEEQDVLKPFSPKRVDGIYNGKRARPRCEKGDSVVGEREEATEETSPLAALIVQLTTALTQIGSTQRAETDLPPFDGTYAARQFFQAYDRKMDGALGTTPDKLLRVPSYLTRHHEEPPPTLPDPYTSTQRKTSVWTAPYKPAQHASAQAVQTAPHPQHPAPGRAGQAARDAPAFRQPAPLPFGILGIDTLRKFKPTIDFNQGTMFQLAAPLSSTTYHFAHLPNECAFWECQTESQRAHNTHKPSAHGTHRLDYILQKSVRRVDWNPRLVAWRNLDGKSVLAIGLSEKLRGVRLEWWHVNIWGWGNECRQGLPCVKALGAVRVLWDRFWPSPCVHSLGTRVGAYLSSTGLLWGVLAWDGWLGTACTVRGIEGKTGWIIVLGLFALSRVAWLLSGAVYGYGMAVDDSSVILAGAFLWMLLLLALHLDDPVDHLKDGMRGLAVPRTEEVIIAPIDISCATSTFFHRLEQTDKIHREILATHRQPAPTMSHGNHRKKWSSSLITAHSTRPIQVIIHLRILEAMSSAKITYSIKGGPRKSKPWFDKDCYDMKKLAKESLKKYRETNRLEDRECYASSRKKYLALLDLKRKGFDNEKQEILRNAKDSKTFWKTIALYKSKSIIQGEIAIQDWLNFYRELITTENFNLHNVISQNDPILDTDITNADIYKEIAGLKNNKACGPNGIPKEVLKILPDSYILLLKQLYNSVITTGKYPAIWTNSTIHPIFKNGYKNSPSNYRDIALISNVSKLFTSILRSRLEEWVEGRRVVPENQAGFRKGRSCIDHIFTLTTLIQLSLRKKRGKLYVFFVDLRKAFDTVPHSILWKILYNLGISYQFISTIRSYYEQATIAIRWKGSFTESIKINTGVLQGEPLSSIAIIGESRMNLQKKIKILKEYLDENLMTLNESKSKIMVFRNGGKPSNKDRWFRNDKPITITSRYTYLGFPLTPTITTNHLANYFKGKSLTAINATHPLLIKSKAKSINLSTKLFDTIVRAVLMYAAPLWATEHKDLLDSIQDIFIRRFLNLPRYTPGYIIRLETGRISLSVTALKLTLKYWLRVLNMSSDRLPRICFNRTRELSNASGTPIGFIKKLTNLLNNNGYPALASCDDPETLRSAITGLLKTAADQSIQNDLTRMDKSKLYSHYKDIHISFMTEGYLLGDFPFSVVRLLAQGLRALQNDFEKHPIKTVGNLRFTRIRRKEEEETEDDEVKEEIMMLTRGEVIAALETLQKLSKTSADIDVHFEDDLDKIRRECLKQCPIKYHQKTITDFLKPAEKTQI
ncbi:hypothetical protein LAZ67_7001291 [Cordylochernes scorpioides]|uniref:Reverse transcriptase domain-containing protein n=1 Tax=Cordylochernes scorpioides TaxID=51811 RepID=A0ABY6KP22_9ARAC|nr:hypothetical protein LAZ67_7001291 [Cordylochernes scorpioides]